jgi:hypothetical protein
MSCNPGTPCYNTQTVYSGCGNDPCNPNSRISCDGVVYAGPNLPCTGIEACDTLCAALQKIDDSICNSPGFTVTADNGLTKTLNNIQLGGSLIQNTTIGTSSINTLSITGLVIDPEPDYILTETSLGVVRRTLASAIVSDVTADNGLTKTLNNIRLGGNLVVPTTIGVNGSNTFSITGLSTDSSPTFLLTETSGLIRKTPLGTVANVTASNGLNKVGSDIQLGGPLTSPTTITIAGSNNLSIANLATDTNPGYVVSVDNTTGLLKKSALSTLANTADNGLTKTSNNIRLGGPLVTPTTITADVTNTITFAGLVTDNSPVYVVTQNGTDVTRRTAVSTLLANITAKNGLTKIANEIELGGPLAASTTIGLSTNTLTFSAAPTHTTALSIIPGAASPNPTSGVDRIAITGNLSVSAQSYFFGNVGMGATPFLPTDNTDVRLNTFKVGLPDTGKLTIGASSSSTELTTAGIYTGATTSYFGGFSRINFTINGTGAQVLKTGGTYTGGLSYFQFGTGRDVSGGICSAHAAQAQFAKASLGGPSGTIDRVIAYRAMRPVADALVGYNGTITEMVGLQIEDQSGPIGTGTVASSYAIKQLSASDNNQFQGPSEFVNQQFRLTNLPVYASDAAADAALPAGCLYRITGSRQILITLA